LTEDEIHKIDAVELSHWWYRGTREIFFSLLAPYVEARPPLRILDIGCGTGGNLLEMARLGEASGIDVDPLCVDYCRRKGLRAELGSMLDVRAAAASLDLVTMFEVLTQVDSQDMDRVLSGIAKAVKPGGLIAFREPGMPVARGAHDRAVNIRQRLTTRGVRDALVGAGFEPLRVTYMNTLLFPPIVAFRRLQDALSPQYSASDVKPTSGLLNTALLAVLRVEKLLLRRIDLPFGVSVFAIGRRTGG
jgi:SAM-dependent methyltransferase